MSRPPFRRRLKALAVVLLRLSQLPVHQEGQLATFPSLMKPIHFALAAFVTSLSTARSQDEPASAPTSARIIGEIPDGTPQALEAPKPGFIVPPKDILESETHLQGGRKIIIQQINPIDLPFPPEPPTPVERTSAENAAFRQKIADYRAAHPVPETLLIGATVYRSKDTAPRTLATIQQKTEGDDRKIITFWSSADFALLSGVSNFMGSDGRKLSLMMSWGNQDIDRTTEMLAAHGRVYHAPAIPELPPGNATFIITSGIPNAATLTAIQSLHDLYNNEHQKLLAAYQGREQARLAAEAELKAHPRKPKDIVLNYWLGAAPAPAAKGEDQ